MVDLDTVLIEEARRIGPILYNETAKSESAGRLTQISVDALSDAGLLSMLTPRALGGLEVDPITYAHVIEEVTQFDSSSGWTLTNPLLWAYLCSRLSADGADEILGNDPRAMLAATLAPSITAVPVDGGYRVSGKGVFASNCRHAVWFASACAVAQSTSKPSELVWVYLPAEDCRIIDTWDVLGLRGTGSDDFEVDDVFVPYHRTFPFTAEYELGPKFQGDVYQFSLMGMITAALPPVLLGIARSAITEAKNISESKIPAGATTSLAHRPWAQYQFAKAEAELRACRALLYETLGRVWKQVQSGHTIELEDRADLLLAATKVAESTTETVDMMYRVGGTTGIYTGSRLEACLRDIRVATQNRFYTDVRYETFGQIYFGLPHDYMAALLL